MPLQALPPFEAVFYGIAAAISAVTSRTPGAFHTSSRSMNLLLFVWATKVDCSITNAIGINAAFITLKSSSNSTPASTSK